jgi:hypothetical protein
MSDHPRRPFTPPCDIDDNGAYFIVRDASGQALSYVHYENEPGRRAAAGSLTRDEARRIAINIAKLPELLKRPGYAAILPPSSAGLYMPPWLPLVR